MNNKDFDKFIREQLGKLETDFDGQHWEMMEHRLNTEPAPEGEVRQPESLDDVVKNKLQSIEVAFDENHWALMDQKLEAELMSPEMEDIYLDGIAYDNLFDLNAPYNPSHWTLMSKRLDEAFSLRHKIVKYKIAEVAIMLLAIFTLLPYLPLSKPHKGDKLPVVIEQQQQRLIPSIADAASPKQEAPASPTYDAVTGQAAISPLVTTSEEQHQITDDVDAKNSIANVANSLVDQNAAEGPIAATVLDSQNSASATSSNQAIPSRSKALRIEKIASRHTPLAEGEWPVPADIMNFLKRKSKSIQEALFGPLEPQLQLADAKKPGFLNDKERAIAAGMTDIQAEERLSAKDPIAGTIEPQALVAETIDSRVRLLKSEERAMPAGMMHLLPEKRKRVRLGMFGAFDMNYVMATSNAGFSIPSYDQFFAGYGGGLSLGVGGEKWEVDVAAIYASTYYVPRRLNIDLRQGSFAGGWYGRGLAGARIEMLKVPINIHRSMGKIGKTNISALIGASANVALFANYETRVVQVGIDPNNPQPTSFEEGSDNDIPSFDGVLEGGRLKNNLYLTANLGLRLERDLTARWSVFMQPSYQHRILSSGFGPTNDRINALSVYLGARVNLK